MSFTIKLLSGQYLAHCEKGKPLGIATPSMGAVFEFYESAFRVCRELQARGFDCCVCHADGEVYTGPREQSKADQESIEAEIEKVWK